MKHQCMGSVWKKDTYRRTGHGPTGFEMNYINQRCKRKVTGDAYCWQHAKLIGEHKPNCQCVEHVRLAMLANVQRIVRERLGK